jgi:very-short-patch-repair endonuclease
MPHAVVSPRQRGRAKQLRRGMTRAETLLWRYLKAHHVDDLSFRRQVPIRNYIADFVCHSARLIVELDGETHDFESRQQEDRRREIWFESQGYAVLRFTNEEVVKNLDGVVIVIAETATSRLRSIPPSLSLPHKGGGNPPIAISRVAHALSPPLPRKRGREQADPSLTRTSRSRGEAR